MKLLLLDIDGVILPASPDPELPYMKRLGYLMTLIKQERERLGYPPIEDDKIPKEHFRRRESTDLGEVMVRLHPNHQPLSFSGNIQWEDTGAFYEEIELILKSQALIEASMRYYFHNLDSSLFSIVRKYQYM